MCENYFMHTHIASIENSLHMCFAATRASRCSGPLVEQPNTTNIQTPEKQMEQGAENGKGQDANEQAEDGERIEYHDMDVDYDGFDYENEAQGGVCMI